MIYHIVVGDLAANPLLEAVSMEPTMAGEVVVLKDILHVGPLQKAEGQPFSDLRSAFWNEVAPNEKSPAVVDDMERILAISNAMYKDETIKAWIWMAPGPADVCAYHWLLFYFSKHSERFFVVNIANLPFLDANGKVFYPKSIGEILPKELVKARKLARPVTPSEVEIDGDEWRKLVTEDTGLRTHEGGKKLASRAAGFYDEKLMAYCTPQFQKAHKVLHQAMSKEVLPTGDIYLAWRLRQMALAGLLTIQGDTTKTTREWEVKLADKSTEV